jgi:hypothetical protein
MQREAQGDAIMNDELAGTPRVFSIGAGGPFTPIARALRLSGATGTLNARRLVAITWIPLMVGSLVRVAVLGRHDPIFLDFAVHARFLLALPLLLLSYGLLDIMCRAAVTQLYAGQLADPLELDRIIDRAEHQRDSGWAEVMFAVIAVAGGQLALWQLISPTGVFHGVESVETSFTRIWFAGFALPLLHFLALRWLWRWLIWCGILVSVSRLRLATIATHPDRACGLRFLSGPITAFAMFELAFAAVLSAAWAMQLLAQRATIPSLLPTLIAFIAISVAVACAPLLLFSPHLLRRQREALIAYNPLSLDYVRQFDKKWIGQHKDTELLGTPDIQSLADLAGAYQVIQETGIFVVASRKLFELLLATLIAVLPLALVVIPVDALVKRLASVLLGGLLP